MEKNVDDIWLFIPAKGKFTSVQAMKTCGGMQV